MADEIQFTIADPAILTFSFEEMAIFVIMGHFVADFFLTKYVSI